MNQEEIKKEYDNYFSKNPQKWITPEKNLFAMGVIKEYCPDPKNIIDVGCGNGHMLETCSKEFPEAELVGLEISKQAIEIASQKLPQAKFVEKFLEEYTSRTKFDLVLNMGTVEHIENLDQALINLKKLVRAEGVIYFEAPDNLTYSPGKKIYRRLRIGSKQMEWHLERNDWELRFQEAGFEILAGYYGRKPAWKNIWVLA